MMPDREKVIKGLEYCEEYFNCCDKCPYWDGGTHCTSDLAHDALELLKEQDAVVLCKDCKHCFIEGENVRFNVCKLNHCKVQSDDWFCADGKRKG